MFQDTNCPLFSHIVHKSNLDTNAEMQMLESPQGPVFPGHLFLQLQHVLKHFSDDDAQKKEEQISQVSKEEC